MVNSNNFERNSVLSLDDNTLYTWRIESRGKVYHKLYVECSHHHEIKEPKPGLLNMLKHVSELIWMRTKLNFQKPDDGETEGFIGLLSLLKSISLPFIGVFLKFIFIFWFNHILCAGLGKFLGTTL